jgi:hypothetical protein
MSTCNDLQSTGGILSHCKTALDIAIVYLGVYHAPLVQIFFQASKTPFDPIPEHNAVSGKRLSQRNALTTVVAYPFRMKGSSGE